MTGPDHINAPDDQPAVTMTLFAYNQEAYIRDAVAGCFAQDYARLEIILSDDCSTDRTFAIMQEMAQAYRGPHRVILRRNPVNMGVIAHYCDVWDSVTSDIIVLAAGDDISLPTRVSVSVARLMAEPSAVLVHSGTMAIDDAGAIVGRFDPPITRDDPDPLRIAAHASIYIGATGAFRTSFYRQFGAITQRDTFEDLVLGYRAALLRGMRYMDETLVNYRVGVGVSFEHQMRRLDRTPRRIKAIRRHLGTLRQRRQDLDRVDHPDKTAIAAFLDAQIARTLARQQLYSDRSAFLRGLFSRRPYWYVRALSAEAKFKLRLIG